MQERRRQPRKDLMSYSQVFDFDGGILIGYLGDLTNRGAMVIGDNRMKVERELTVQIQLPELDNISDETLTLPVRVAWCQQDISPDYYNIGLEFREMSERQRLIIKAILEKYEFRRQKPDYPLHPNELNIAE